MTTRDQARRVAGDLRVEGAARSAASEPIPPLPERLLAARERKGVDLYRAERDTKIRARYLGALERGEWRELPGAVYTKGFLRNYALYLGLDPEDVLGQWKRERGDAGPAEPVIVVPRPILAPRQSLTFSTNVFVAALLTVLIALFVVYLGIQVFRFAKPPTIAVTDPAVAVLEVDESASDYTLRGTSIAGATVSISSSVRSEPILVTTGPTGVWTATVPLQRGKNQFEITAKDPDTGKPSERAAQVIITVPFSVVQAPTLTIDQPAEGATFENGAIPIAGTSANATTVVVSATYLGPAAGEPVAAEPSPPARSAPASKTAEVDGDGAFNAGLELTAGRWSLTVTAQGRDGKTTALTRSVVVQYRGVNLVVNVKGGRAWLKVWVDDQIVESVGPSGSVFRDGKTLTFTGTQSVKVWTGSSGTTWFTLNGRDLGRLGKSGVPEIWLFAPPAVPEKLERP